MIIKQQLQEKRHWPLSDSCGKLSKWQLQTTRGISKSNELLSLTEADSKEK